MQKYTVSLAAAMILSSSLFSFSGNYSFSHVKDDLSNKIKNRNHSDNVAATAREITPVIDSNSRVNSDSTSLSAEEEETNMVSSSPASSTTRIFGGNSIVSSTGVKSVVKVTSGGGNIADPTTGLHVPGICGREDFDDIIQKTYSKVDLSETYIDINNKECVLGDMRLLVKVYSPKDAEWVEWPKDKNFFVQNHYYFGGRHNVDFFGFSKEPEKMKLKYMEFSSRTVCLDTYDFSSCLKPIENGWNYLNLYPSAQYIVYHHKHNGSTKVYRNIMGYFPGKDKFQNYASWYSVRIDLNKNVSPWDRMRNQRDFIKRKEDFASNLRWFK